MQKQPPSSFCAVAAIAAALALGSTAAQAQDAGPAPNVPTIAPPAPTVPVSAAPAPAASSAQVSTPVVQPVPTAATPAPAPQQAPAARTATRPGANAARPSVRTTAARPAASTAASAPAAAAVPAAVIPPPAPAAPVAVLDPAPRAEPAPATQPQPQLGLGGAEAGLLALLAAGGLAGAGFMVARSRRRRDDEEMAETEAVADRAAVIPVAAPEPIFQRQPEPRPEPAAPRIALPTGEIPAGAEREELLRRMVAAAPDEENPFTSPRARRKRACLILQHRAHLQAQGSKQDDGAKPFDWRTYRPTQTAARVDEPA